MSDELYKKAKKRVKKKKEFYIHLFTFIPVMSMLAFVSLYITPEAWWWFLFPLVGWGTGLLAHYFEAFKSTNRFLGKQWEEDQIEMEMAIMKDSQSREKYLREELPNELEEEKLKLKELEKRYRDDDLV